MGWNDNIYSKKLLVTGAVKEEFTGVQFNVSKSIELKEKNYKFEKLYTPKMAKPGLSYTAYVSNRVALERFWLEKKHRKTNFGL